jgi:hypothetical protein
MTRHRALSALIGSAFVVIGLASPALAGPPLVCFPFEIGTAASLPWNPSTGSYKGMRPDYDITRLNGDVLALLTPKMPVIVRMETLRRAALYASADDAIAHGLLDTIRARADHGSPTDALTRFDAGYLIETYKQLAQMAPAMGRMTANLDGYALVTASLEARHGDPAIAFAAALITSGSGAYAEHVRMAKSGTGADVLLAKNIDHVR